MAIQGLEELLLLPAEARLLQHYSSIAVFSALPDAWESFEPAEWFEGVARLKAELVSDEFLDEGHEGRFLTALQDVRDPITWRRLLVDVADVCQPQWRVLAMLGMALPPVDDDDWWLLGGVGERRLNAVLDVVDFPRVLR